MRERARQRANVVIDNAFAEHPASPSDTRLRTHLTPLRAQPPLAAANERGTSVNSNW
jgi:hypothetical protein